MYLVDTTCTSPKHDQTTEHHNLIYSVAVVREEEDCEMCSEVKHERFDTGSDTVIHSTQIKTHLSQELTVISAKDYRNIYTVCNNTMQALHDQSEFVAIFWYKE